MIWEANGWTKTLWMKTRARFWTLLLPSWNRENCYEGRVNMAKWHLLTLPWIQNQRMKWKWKPSKWDNSIACRCEKICKASKPKLGLNILRLKLMTRISMFFFSQKHGGQSAKSFFPRAFLTAARSPQTLRIPLGSEWEPAGLRRVSQPELFAQRRAIFFPCLAGAAPEIAERALATAEGGSREIFGLDTCSFQCYFGVRARSYHVEPHYLQNVA